MAYKTKWIHDVVGKVVAPTNIERRTRIDSLKKCTLNPFARSGSWMQRIVKRLRRQMTGPHMVSAQTFSDKAFLSLFNLKEVSTLLAQGNMPPAKAALVSYLGRRDKPAWPRPPATITDLRLNIDELSKEELISLADCVLEYRFTPDGAVPRIDSDGQIDWNYNPISSPEWLWRLNRHQWWPVLALAYERTGDERYAMAFVSQMLDWVNKNPPPPRKNELSPTWRLMEVGLRVRVSWIPAFALFYKSPTFTDEAKLIMLRSILDHARFLSLFRTERNHLLRESNGLAYVSVYFPEFKEAKLWRQVALKRLDDELTKQVNHDGSHIEVSTGYQWLVADEFEKTYDLLRSNNLSLPKEDLAAWLEKMYLFLAYLVRPDGTFPEINDGFLRWKYTRLAQIGKKLGRDDLIYLGTAGNQGTLPQKTSVGFNNAGLYVMRSDWSREACYLIFDAGPYGGFHGHEDKLSIEVFAFGKPFIVDSGSYTYEKRDPFRNYFVGSQGHNTVLVDGQSQIRRWKRENLIPKRTLGNYATWISQVDFDYVAATYDDGYGFFSLEKPEEPKIIKDVIHTRRILFVKPEYWVIVDELQSTIPHTFQLLFHTHPEMKVMAKGDNRVALGTAPDTACLYLIPDDTIDTEVRWLAGSESPIQGWYSVDHHRKTPSNVVVYERKNSLSAIMTTLLYPCPLGQSGDQANIERLKVFGGNGLAFVITTNRGRDYVMFSQDDSLKEFGPYQSKGIIAGIRTDSKGDVQTQFERS